MYDAKARPAKPDGLLSVWKQKSALAGRRIKDMERFLLYNIGGVCR